MDAQSVSLEVKNVGTKLSDEQLEIEHVRDLLQDVTARVSLLEKRVTRVREFIDLTLANGELEKNEQIMLEQITSLLEEAE